MSEENICEKLFSIRQRFDPLADTILSILFITELAIFLVYRVCRDRGEHLLVLIKKNDKRDGERRGKYK